MFPKGSIPVSEVMESIRKAVADFLPDNLDTSQLKHLWFDECLTPLTSFNHQDEIEGNEENFFDLSKSNLIEIEWELSRHVFRKLCRQIRLVFVWDGNGQPGMQKALLLEAATGQKQRDALCLNNLESGFFYWNSPLKVVRQLG